MKRIFITLIAAMIAVMSLTACGPKEQTPPAETGPIDPVIEIDPDDEELLDEDFPDEELPEGMEKTYELSGLEYYDAENGTWVDADCVPGAEKFVFHEDLSCEYIYRDYPTYEDMMNDSNYEIVSKTGYYLPVPEENGVSMMIEGYPITAGLYDDELIMEQEYNGSPAVRGIYTEVQ